MRRLSCLSRTLRLRRFEVVCGEGGVQSAGSCVMGTLDMSGSKFLSIVILMGIWLGADGGDICFGVTPLRRWGGDLSTFTFLSSNEAQFVEYGVAGKP